MLVGHLVHSVSVVAYRTLILTVVLVVVATGAAARPVVVIVLVVVALAMFLAIRVQLLSNRRARQLHVVVQ